MSRAFSFSAKVVGGNLCRIGNAKIFVNLSKDAIDSAFRFPGDIPLKMQNIADFDYIAEKSGWQSPKEILKVIGVTVLSIFGAGVILKNIDPSGVEEILSLAITGQDVEPLMETLETLADVSTDVPDDPSAVAIGVVLASLAGPGAYGGVVLSRRRVRFQLVTSDNKYVEIVAPEPAAAFVAAIHLAKKKNGNGNGNGNGEPTASE